MATYERLRFDEAVEFFKQKIPLPSESWEQIINEAQDFAFSIAGVESALVLQAVYDKLLQILEAQSKTADTFQEFANTFQQTMQAAGYGEQSPWRVALVYKQNIRTAYNAGRYRQQTDPELMAANPYLQWVHDHPLEPRPAHKALHLKVFRADDPLWKILYVPCGFGCCCRVFSLSDRDLKREGLTVEQFPSTRVEIRDRITGKTQQVPAIEVDGVVYPIAEPGFTTAPGSSPLEQRQQILEGALNRLSPSLRELAQQQIESRSFAESLDFAQLKETVLSRLSPALQEQVLRELGFNEIDFFDLKQPRDAFGRWVEGGGVQKLGVTAAAKGGGALGAAAGGAIAGPLGAIAGKALGDIAGRQVGSAVVAGLSAQEKLLRDEQYQQASALEKLKRLGAGTLSEMRSQEFQKTLKQQINADVEGIGAGEIGKQILEALLPDEINIPLQGAAGAIAAATGVAKARENIQNRLA